MALTKVINKMIATASILLSPFTMSTGKLLGRSTASTGAIEEITIGTGLSLTGGTLAATGGGVSSFNTRTGAITLTTADVNNTIVTGNAVGAVLTCRADTYSSTNPFVVGTSYSGSSEFGTIQGTGGNNTAYAISSAGGDFYTAGTKLSLTGTWKCIEIIEIYYTDNDGTEDAKSRYAPLYRFQRTA